MMTLPTRRKRPHESDGSSQKSNCDGQSSSNVKVVVRIRPPNVKEVEGNFREVVQAVDENILVFDPKEINNANFGGRRPRDIRKRANRDLKFAFDRVFGPSSTNTDVYNETTNVVLDGVLNGYNCSVFAYGATGAGKTHTMLGSKDQPGVMYHTMVDLYSRIDSMKDTKTCDVAVSYLEVYNETIRDLLMPGPPLPIREDPGQGVVIPGLSLHKPKTADELLYMLQYGNQHRTQHPTDANAESSRSHAVFQVFVRQKDRTANISTEVRMAKLCLVDLAGSERGTVNKNRGSRLREGANINRSLLALGNVINALAENKNKGFVPYRDSKLTRLLKDSLGGNCQTVMIAAVSPSAMSFEDTYNTLRYADRAKNIKAVLKKNVLNVDFHLAKYGQIVEELRKEIKELKGKLQGYESGKMVSTKQSVGSCGVSVDYSSQQGELYRLFMGHQTLVCNQVHAEISLRSLQWKMFRKSRCLARLGAVNDPVNTEHVQKVEAMLSGMKQKSSCMEISSESDRSKVAVSCQHLYDTEQKYSQGKNGNSVPEVLSLSVKVHKVETELQTTKLHLSYTKHVVRCQERELYHNEHVLNKALSLLAKQHHMLQASQSLTPDLREEYTALQSRIAGQELTWEDESSGACNSNYDRGYTLAEMLELPVLKIKPNSVSTGKSAPPQAVESRLKPGSVFEFRAKASTAVPTDNYPYKAVDECSPPRAKRAMTSHQQQSYINPHAPPSRVGRSRHRSTPPKKGLARSQSFSGTRARSETSSQKDRSYRNTSYSSSNRKAERNIRSNPNGSAPILNLGSNFDADDDDTPEMRSQSKFSRINDTITKSKKFSHLHTKPDVVLENDPAQCTENMDDTFTVDPETNPLPVSVIPHVDGRLGSVEEMPSCACENGAQTKSVISHSVTNVNACEKCTCSSVTYVKNSRKSLDYESQRANIEPAHIYSYCVDEPQTGSQPGYGENDSGASTLVDQSTNSVTSLASISTLVEGQQNSSQNLSGMEEKGPMYTSQNKCTTNTNTHETVKRNSLEPQTQTTSDVKPKRLSSETVTKSKPSVLNSQQSGTKVNTSATKAVRSIKFENDENPATPNRGKSYADIVRTPTPDRQPLRQVGHCNTPLSTPRTDSARSSLTSSDNDSFTKAKTRGGRVSSLRLSSDSEESSKENRNSLDEYGLPRLAANSLMTRKGERKTSSGTPSYMQATKSHAIKSKFNTSKSSSSLNSSDEGISTKLAPVRIKNSFINRSARPLSSHMRSKSVSNLSTRAAWQH